MNRIIFFLVFAVTAACSSVRIKNREVVAEQKTIIYTNPGGKGQEITIDFSRGSSFYYPLMAAWLEDADGNYIQTLYVPVSVATGVFKYGKQEKNRWLSAAKRAPQTLPYWAHKRGNKASDGLFMPEPANPVPDAYTGATPLQGFLLHTRADNELPDRFKVLFEINQNWDWNEYWTNNKYPDDENYKMSCQPAIVYETLIDMTNRQQSYTMKAIGHSHYSGRTGELFTDLSTITSALEIADSITVSVR